MSCTAGHSGAFKDLPHSLEAADSEGPNTSKVRLAGLHGFCIASAQPQHEHLNAVLPML